MRQTTGSQPTLGRSHRLGPKDKHDTASWQRRNDKRWIKQQAYLGTQDAIALLNTILADAPITSAFAAVTLMNAVQHLGGTPPTREQVA